MKLINIYERWSPTNKIFFWIGICPIIITLVIFILDKTIFQQKIALTPNINISESDTKITNGISCGNEEITTTCSIIETAIKNTGGKIAKDIKFVIYGVWLKEELNFDKPIEPVRKFYDENMTGTELPPSESKILPRIDIGYLNRLGEQIALIYYIEYKDDNKNKYKIEKIQYTVGGYEITSLIDADYKKIYDRLKMKLTSDNQYPNLLKFLENNPPK